MRKKYYPIRVSKCLKLEDILGDNVNGFKEHNNLLNILLFIKKHNGEGSDFYFIGQVIPKDDSFKEVKMKDKNQNDIPVVKLEFILTTPVEDHLYEYLTESTS